MGRCVIKTGRSENLYMVWSSVVNNAIAVGTHQELIEEEWIREAQAERADEHGTSSRSSFGGWDTKDILVVEVHHRRDAPSYRLDREDFTQYAKLLLAEKDAEAEALLIPDHDG